MGAMREKRTIGEWMDLAREWNDQCQHGNAADTCATCIGALHPVLSATAIHLQKLLEGKSPGSAGHHGEILKLSIETDELFHEISATFVDLSDVESTPATERAAARERRDISIIANDIDALVTRFAEVFPDIREQTVSAAVRQTAM